MHLTARRQTLMLEAKAGAHFDTLMLLPQTNEMDRAAMNLLQNWDFATWLNPF
jgi:hypothetical protein